jgi:hypothetical protein
MGLSKRIWRRVKERFYKKFYGEGEIAGCGKLISLYAPSIGCEQMAEKRRWEVERG